MSATAGWYTDPGGAVGRLRWWDGERWTEHTTPVPAGAAATATSDATAWGSGSAGTAFTPPNAPSPGSGPGGAGEGPVWAAGGSSWSGGAAGHHAGGPVRGRAGAARGPRTWVIVVVVLGVVLLGLVVMGVVGLVSATSSLTATSGSTSAGRTPTAAGPTVGPGEHVSGTVALDGTCTTRFQIEEAGLVRIDVRGHGDFDGTVTLRDAAGGEVASNDDRGFDVSDASDGRLLDPLLEVDLEPGDYVVEVAGFAGDAGSFDVAIE